VALITDRDNATFSLPHLPHAFWSQWRTKDWEEGGAGAAGPQSPKPQNRSLKNTEFVGIMISKVLLNLPLS
jgi:hypothetical protein